MLTGILILLSAGTAAVPATPPKMVVPVIKTKWSLDKTVAKQKAAETAEVKQGPPLPGPQKLRLPPKRTAQRTGPRPVRGKKFNAVPVVASMVNASKRNNH